MGDRPVIKSVICGRNVTFELTLPEGVSFAALTDAFDRSVEEIMPPALEPGQVTRNGFASACTGRPHVPWEDCTQEAWAAAESAAREGYVSKAAALNALDSYAIKALDSYDLAHPETRDLVYAIYEIRELVK